MTITSALFQLFLGPLVLLVDVVYSLACNYTLNMGRSLFLLALATSLMMLPLNRGGAAPSKASGKAAGLRGLWRAWRGAMPLAMEIALFAAAFSFFARLSVIREVAYGPIADLGAPDGLIRLGGLRLNQLPILALVAGLIDAAVSLKSMSPRDRWLRIAAAVGYALALYFAPAAMALYWLLFHLFTAAGKLLAERKWAKVALAALCSAAGIVLFVYGATRSRRPLMSQLLGAALQAPLILCILGRFTKPRKRLSATDDDDAVFLFSAVFMTVLTGLLIPSTVIASSPMEFMEIQNLHSPVSYIVSALMLAAGSFLIWLHLAYRLTAPTSRRRWAAVMLAVAGVAVVDYAFFGRHYGFMSSMLEYDDDLVIPRGQMLVNAGVVAAVAAALVFVWKKKPAIPRALAAAGSLALAVMSVTNVVMIDADYRALRQTVTSGGMEQASFALDASGRNVIVMMLDRAISRFFPYIIEEKPELKRQFAGFTYYPNALSYGGCTNIASPSLYGGYDYMPDKLDARADEPLRDKHDEALKVMPTLFLNAGYDVTVCDPSYAGYASVPDLTIYDDHPEIRRFITMGNFYVEGFDILGKMEQTRNRDFFCYSVFRVAPLALHPILYEDGNYQETDHNFYSRQIVSGARAARGLNDDFMESYAVLTHLPSITRVRDSGKGTFLMISNDATHEQTLLQQPDYVPALIVDDRDTETGVRRAADGSELRMETAYQVIHYHCNMATMLQLGRWFDYMREQGVYDNTRIIIVADHGRDLGLFDMQFGDEEYEDAMFYNPLLLVKDFGETELKTDARFMTNADTPALALAGIAKNPVNPFTGHPFTDAQKRADAQPVAFTRTWNVRKNNGNQFRDVTWFTLTGHDVADMSAWEKVGDHPAVASVE